MRRRPPNHRATTVPLVRAVMVQEQSTLMLKLLALMLKQNQTVNISVKGVVAEIILDLVPLDRMVNVI